MSAVMRHRELTKDEPREIHDRCVRWATWARCASPGAEGTSEGYLRERTDHAHDSEPTAEIEATEAAVAKMRVERKDYYRAFERYYLNPTELSEQEVADLIGFHVERVNAMLRQARFLIQYKLLQMERHLA